MKVKYEIDMTLVKERTIADVERLYYEIKGNGGSAAAGIEQKLSIAVLYVWRDLCRYKIGGKGKKLTVNQFYGLRQKTGEEFIHIHRLNYMTYRVLMEFADWLDDRKMMTFNVKSYWKKIEKTFSKYQTEHKSQIDRSAWMTVQDHVRLASDEVMAYLQPLEVAVRDYLIMHREEMVAAGQKDDITILTKIQIALTFCAATRNTFNNFFRDIIANYDVDFTPDFCYADVSSMIRNFVFMTEQLGVKFSKDKDDDYILLCTNMEDSYRVEQAWDAIVAVVTSEEIMNRTALEAINMNPETKADYEAHLRKADDEEVKVALGSLSNRYKVTSL